MILNVLWITILLLVIANAIITNLDFKNNIKIHNSEDILQCRILEVNNIILIIFIIKMINF